VQEYASFGTLDKLQQRTKPLPFSINQKLCYDVGRALSIIHACGMGVCRVCPRMEHLRTGPDAAFSLTWNSSPLPSTDSLANQAACSSTINDCQVPDRQGQCGFSL
jgi:hypothetical protein